MILDIIDDCVRKLMSDGVVDTWKRNQDAARPNSARGGARYQRGADRCPVPSSAEEHHPLVIRRPTVGLEAKGAYCSPLHCVRRFSERIIGTPTCATPCIFSVRSKQLVARLGPFNTREALSSQMRQPHAQRSARRNRGSDGHQADMPAETTAIAGISPRTCRPVHCSRCGPDRDRSVSAM